MSTQKAWIKKASTPEQELLRDIMGRHKGALRLANHFDHETTRTIERWANEGIPKTLIAIVGQCLSTFEEEHK